MSEGMLSGNSSSVPGGSAAFVASSGRLDRLGRRHKIFDHVFVGDESKSFPILVIKLS